VKAARGQDAQSVLFLGESHAEIRFEPAIQNWKLLQTPPIDQIGSLGWTLELHSTYQGVALQGSLDPLSTFLAARACHPRDHQYRLEVSQLKDLFCQGTASLLIQSRRMLEEGPMTDYGGHCRICGCHRGYGDSYRVQTRSPLDQGDRAMPDFVQIAARLPDRTERGWDAL